MKSKSVTKTMKNKTTPNKTRAADVSYCDFCDSTDMRARNVEMKMRHGGRDYSFANVAATVCQKCGHRYFHASVIDELERRIDAGRSRPAA